MHQVWFKQIFLCNFNCENDLLDLITTRWCQCMTAEIKDASFPEDLTPLCCLNQSTTLHVLSPPPTSIKLTWIGHQRTNNGTFTLIFITGETNQIEAEQRNHSAERTDNERELTTCMPTTWASNKLAMQP